MKDDLGLYYYPYPGNQKTRMYVRRKDGDIWFRLWNADDPELWDEHGWVPHGAIREAIKMFRKTGDFDPAEAYDVRVAEDLIRREGKE
ncbi:MAG: hypothetical protein ACOWWM_00410 [Desulfobacterales bacterium]